MTALRPSDVLAPAESTTAGDHAAAAGHDPVHHPSHYMNHPSGIECIAVTRLLSFDLGNGVKYVWRRGDKGNPAQDLDKSLFYFDDAAAHRPTRPAAGLWRRIADAARCVRGGSRAPSVDLDRYTPPAAADLLLCVADHEPEPDAAEFYRSVAAMDWDHARAAVLRLRAACAD